MATRMTPLPILAVGTALALAACKPEPTLPMAERTTDRVSISRIAVVEDELAYGAKRGIYIIVDQKTGREFIGISGVGISELGSHKAGKTSTSDER